MWDKETGTLYHSDILRRIFLVKGIEIFTGIHYNKIPYGSQVNGNPY